MTTEPQRHTRASEPNWREVLDRHAPVLLLAAHDGLTARLIEQAGFVAFQVGGRALENEFTPFSAPRAGDAS